MSRSAVQFRSRALGTHETVKVTIETTARDTLRRHVLEPLVSRCLDQEYGGFLVDFDDQWRAHGTQEKSLEHAARTTMAFAVMDAVMPGEGCDRVARHGFDFLLQAMWDHTDGGFFARVDQGGQPMWDGMKHPHGAMYAVQALHLGRHLLPRGESDGWADRALAWLDDVAWDDRHGGYWGTYRRTNDRYEDGSRLPTPDGRDVLGLSSGLKEVNTLGDAIEMLTSIAGADLPHGNADRLDWTVGQVTDQLMDPGGVLPYVYRRDWRPLAGLVRVGHQIQMARRLAVAPLGPARTDEVLEKCRQSMDFCLQRARHPDGGFCFAVSGDGRVWPDTGASSDLRLWWVQLEAVHALHLLSSQERMDGGDRARYRRELELQWTFLRDHFFDERHGGIREVPLCAPRLWPRNRSPRRKTHAWKDPYHEVAMLMALAADA